MSVVLARPPREVAMVVGSDARSFLQSLISQDLDAVPDGAGARSLLLTPQGKLDVDLGLARVGDEIWLVCEAGFGDQLVASLRRFKIRVDAEVELRPDLDVLTVLGADDVPGNVVPSPWPGGVEVVASPEALRDLEAELEGHGAQRWSPDEYEANRITAGVPRQGFELDEKTIPQEAFLERDAVSFDKGCFLGQELVCRIDTRGHVNKYLRRLTEIDGAPPPRGAEVVVGEKVVGTVTSATDGVALGYVRREVEPPAEVTLRWDGGTARAAVEALPA